MKIIWREERNLCGCMQKIRAEDRNAPFLPIRIGEIPEELYGGVVTANPDYLNS